MLGLTPPQCVVPPLCLSTRSRSALHLAPPLQSGDRLALGTVPGNVWLPYSKNSQKALYSCTRRESHGVITTCLHRPVSSAAIINYYRLERRDPMKPLYLPTGNISIICTWIYIANSSMKQRTPPSIFLQATTGIVPTFSLINVLMYGIHAQCDMWCLLFIEIMSVCIIQVCVYLPSYITRRYIMTCYMHSPCVPHKQKCAVYLYTVGPSCKKF